VILSCGEIEMLRVKKIIRHPKLRRFWTKWRILMWKAVLMRLH